MKFNTRDPQEVQDFGDGQFYTWHYRGKCLRCKSTLYSTDEGDPDPRGIAGVKHSCATMIASEHSMKGPDLYFCYDCLSNDSTTYRQCFEIACDKWEAK